MNRFEDVDQSLEGHYAGPFTRLVAYVADAFLMAASYGVLLSVVVFVFNLAARSNEIEAPSQTTLWYAGGLLLWILFYNGFCWALWWKTPGKSLLGLRVVERDGADLRVRVALRRAIWWQLCFLVPFSHIGIIVGNERRSLHDVLANTTVVYDWNARDARWRLLAARRIRLDHAQDPDHESDRDIDNEMS